jgi:hypothetical protein
MARSQNALVSEYTPVEGHVTLPSSLIHHKKGEDMHFKTHDLGQAAFLVAKGFELTHLETDARGRSAFVFAPEAGNIAPAFFDGAAVPALMMAQSLRLLKGYLHRTAYAA